jgi:4'-phosphopantetheinyl transferase
MIANYVSVSDKLDKKHFQALRQKLPEALGQRNDRYIQYLDRQRNLFGLLLLKLLWSGQYNEELALENLKTTEFGRPYLPQSTADFSISHAGDFVICVLAPGMRVGIDIEKKKQVDFQEFTSTMNPEQWKEINRSHDAEATFFKYWCTKESVIKADGRGLSIPLTEIKIESDIVSYSHQIWHVSSFKIDADHFGCLACDHEVPQVELTRIHWLDFLP